MTRFHPKAIIIAMLLSLALDVVGAFFLHALFGTGFSEGMTNEQIKAAALVTQQQTGFLLASLLYGTGTTVLGGYIAARLSPSYPYFNAFAVGALGIALGLVLTSTAPAWVDALAYLISVPAAIWGGHLGRRNE